MTSLIHSLHIGTLATWLSVAGFGTVAVIVPNKSASVAPRIELPDTQWLAEDFTLGAETSPAVDQVAPETVALATPETLSKPEEMPDLTAFEPLPEIPDLPQPPSVINKPAPPIRPSARRDVEPRAARSLIRSGASSGTVLSGKASGNPGLSSAARLAAGHMPPPVYPAEARRSGQTGTLVVEFTVDASGRVIAAYAKSPSPWPILNNEAVRTVRRWTFPPGPVMKLQRPIVFQLR